MTQKITGNSNGFLESWQNAQDRQNRDTRTPLRDLVLYENPAKGVPAPDENKINTSSPAYIRCRDRVKSNMEEALEELAMRLFQNPDQTILQMNKNVELI